MSKTTWNEGKASAYASSGPEARHDHRSTTGGECNAHPSVTKAGAEARYTTVKREDHHRYASTTVAGPSVGGNVGARYRCSRDASVGLGADLSLGKAKVQSGPAFAEGNVNVNTGAEIGTSGAKLNVLGFGAHLGAGGRYSVDTPLGSLGFKK